MIGLTVTGHYSYRKFWGDRLFLVSQYVIRVKALVNVRISLGISMEKKRRKTVLAGLIGVSFSQASWEAPYKRNQFKKCTFQKRGKTEKPESGNNMVVRPSNQMYFFIFGKFYQKSVMRPNFNNFYKKNWSCNQFQLSSWPNFDNFYQNLVTWLMSIVITIRFR